MKVALCVPSLTGLNKMYVEAMEKSIPLLHESGIEDVFIHEYGCPYISHARAKMLRKALDVGAEQIVFTDYDLSWKPTDLLDLIQADGDVVAGIYRYKKDEVEYMGTIVSDAQGYPMVKDDCLQSDRVPAGFLKITRDGVNKFMRAYPELCFGDPINFSVDLFNHGAIDGVWYGEDYAFSKRWVEKFGYIKLLPDLDITHWKIDFTGKADPVPFEGNYHKFLLNCPRK